MRLLRELHFSQAGLYGIYERDQSHFLYVICPVLGWSSLCVEMTSEEVRQFEQDVESLGRLALKICRHPAQFASRMGSAALHSEIEKLVASTGSSG